MTPSLTPEQRAEQLLMTIGYTTVFISHENEKGLAWRADDAARLKQAIVTALRQVERATWEEAAQALLRHNAHAVTAKCCCWKMPTKTANCIANDFRRRSAGE